MRVGLFLFFIASSTAFGQSAKKLNGQLRAELSVERQKSDSVRSLFQQESMILEQARKELSEHITIDLYSKEKTLKKLRSDIYTAMNNIKDLELDATDVFPNGVKFDSHPKYKSFMKPLEEPLGSIPEFKRFVMDMGTANQNRKEQNETLKQLLEKFKAYTYYNIILITEMRESTQQITAAYPSVDSLSGVYQVLISDLEKKSGQLNQKVYDAGENYRKKGPDGFHSGYRTVFPNMHLLDQHSSDAWDTKGEVETGPVASNMTVNEEPPVYEVVDERATFSGGEEEFKKFLKENLFYPTIAKENGVSGTVYIQFVVTGTGSVTDMIILKGIPDCTECDVEVRRALRSMPDWNPAKKNGKTVNSLVILPIQFKP